MLHCFQGKSCQLANPCASNPCANGGQCSAFDSTYICTCPPAFHGQTCKQDVNECAQTPSPCLNGGTCVNEVGSYHCRCPQEYAGKHCDSRYMPCSPSPCQNGGTCVQKGDTTYGCSCLPGIKQKYSTHKKQNNNLPCVVGLETEPRLLFSCHLLVQ